MEVLTVVYKAAPMFGTVGWFQTMEYDNNVKLKRHYKTKFSTSYSHLNEHKFFVFFIMNPRI